MLAYRIVLEPDDNDTLLVTCPDLPGVVTYGADEMEAVAQARDAIETWIAGLIDDDRDVPLPGQAPVTPDARSASVRLPLVTSLKVLLYAVLKESGISRADLAGRLGWPPEAVEDLVALDREARLDRFEAAFAALNRRLSVAVSRGA
ncbi:type II toxin-antitoxin system HicB family antitoxin [Methylobacterium isbiliense]|jgi:antitoxin HicB|uniref:Antitoxin HicB n=1 Tax=Methylobacterium isbiliense TaxID=315478 RepID=A0ABQ4SGU4_9HYPH|nr:type II toxin-antitoxin system HicB family antitoxin [Methylobacterium isbiliense]MDN3624692.1 type II toxin-antitoxin system HicB family antitoxin [Methylobacterium isbiliense]GJE02445.1 Antitoxin HicB [Methylobacterium isbiliense]